MDYSNKTVLVVDHGLFQPLCHAMARHFGRVLYFRHWASSFPKASESQIGKGYKTIERVDNIWDYLDEVDLFIFPDLYDGSLQLHLRSIGKRVWGAAKGEELELQRWEMKQLQKRMGLPTQPVERVIGLKALTETLKKRGDRVVKISVVRGLCESFKVKAYKFVDAHLADVARDLGGLEYGMSEIQEFVVEDMLDPLLEIGYDGYCIDGQFPTRSLFGVEEKGRAYAGTMRDYKALPPQLRLINDKLAPYLKKYQYRGKISTEAIIDKRDKLGYLIDITARSASPAGEPDQDNYTNLADIYWQGAEGVCVDPIPEKKCVVQAMISAEHARRAWTLVEVPPEIRRWFKFYHSTLINGKEYVVPTDAEMNEIGLVDAIGDTFEEAQATLEQYAEQLEGHKVTVDTEAVPMAIKSIKKLL
jgi:hypothetical protein